MKGNAITNIKKAQIYRMHGVPFFIAIARAAMIKSKSIYESKHPISAAGYRYVSKLSAS